jgi:hypothetical protein
MKYLVPALQYLPHVLTVVRGVEDALHGAPGQTKKAAVLTAIGAAASVGEAIPEDHIKLISALIDNTVSNLNAAGIFTHK